MSKYFKLKVTVIVIASLFCTFGLTPARENIFTTMKPAELANLWLMNDCGTDDGPAFEVAITALGAELEPLFLRGLREGPPSERLAEIERNVREETNRIEIYVDLTGLGQPILDLIQRHLASGSRIMAVYFTFGDRRSVDDHIVTLGTAYVVTRLQLLLQTGALHLPRTSKTESLSQELLDYEIKIEPDANERYGAFRVGTRDELVTALGLAAINVGPRKPGPVVELI